MIIYYGHNCFLKGFTVRTVSVAEAKAQLPSLLQAAEAGEQVLITRHGRIVAEVRAFREITNQSWSDGLDWLAERRKQYPLALQEAVSLIREMRDEGDH
jgi:antitoxin (DNA-binding transcriptional repressor) of toxin-antitoxin stability system